MLAMSSILRDERAQLFRLADEYWREIRPTSDHFANDPIARSKYFDDEFWNKGENRFLWWAKLDGAITGFANNAFDPTFKPLRGSGFLSALRFGSG